MSAEQGQANLSTDGWCLCTSAHIDKHTYIKSNCALLLKFKCTVTFKIKFQPTPQHGHTIIFKDDTVNLLANNCLYTHPTVTEQYHHSFEAMLVFSGVHSPLTLVLVFLEISASSAT